MRRLIVTRGPQGAGKTTFLRQLGLEPWLLSADRLREVHAGPVLTAAGTLGVSQEHDRAVWPELMGHLEARMERGELVCLDATHPKAKSFAPYRALVRRHRYAVRVVDFAPVPLARCLAQNAARPAPHAVPEGVLRATHEACLHGAVPDDFPVVRWSEDGAHADAIRAFLDVPVHDLSAYRAVLHVGDLQGCFAPLEALLEREGGLRDDVFHLFVGDLLDRGVENDAVFRWALEHLDRENVAIVWGNHETHLHRWARGLSGKSDEFDLRTRPQLEAAGFGPADADRLCDALHEVFLYRWKDRRVMVCHAGMSTVPERPALVSGHQWAKGVGYYADPVDALFDAQAPAGWVQVHGHRNVPELPLEAAPRSFNLEGKVEFGGALRALRLDAGGFTPLEVPSRRYRPIHERVAHGTLRDRKLYPRWVAPDMPPAPRLGGEVLEALRAHELVYEKRSTTKPWIAAFNFTRDAFFDRRWDALNTTARGLFVDVEEGLVVARSYDKFFNLGERPETTMGALKERLAWPVTGWVKENGYLGIVGYDAREEALVFASKSSLESDFAGWLRELATEALGVGGLEKLRRYLRDAHASMVFEVIDPVRDPHIVAYERPQLVLLDVVRRAARFERMAPERLAKVAKRFGFAAKEKGVVLQEWEAFRRFVERAKAPGFQWKGRELEGFVFEDTAGFQVKLKLDYYAFWKRVRSLKERLRKIRGTGKPLNRDLSDPRIRDVHDWLVKLPDETLEQDVIALRELYLEGHVPPPSTRAVVDEAVRGFERALEQLGAHVAKGGALKATTADDLLAQALAHDGKLDALGRSALRVPLLLAADDRDARREAADRLGIDLD